MCLLLFVVADGMADWSVRWMLAVRVWTQVNYSKLINPEHIHTEFNSTNKHMHSLGRQFYMEAVE